METEEEGVGVGARLVRLRLAALRLKAQQLQQHQQQQQQPWAGTECDDPAIVAGLEEALQRKRHLRQQLAHLAREAHKEQLEQQSLRASDAVAALLRSVEAREEQKAKEALEGKLARLASETRYMRHQLMAGHVGQLHAQQIQQQLLPLTHPQQQQQQQRQQQQQPGDRQGQVVDGGSGGGGGDTIADTEPLDMAQLQEALGLGDNELDDELEQLSDEERAEEEEVRRSTLARSRSQQQLAKRQRQEDFFERLACIAGSDMLFERPRGAALWRAVAGVPRFVLRVKRAMILRVVGRQVAQVNRFRETLFLFMALTQKWFRPAVKIPIGSILKEPQTDLTLSENSKIDWFRRVSQTDLDSRAMKVKVRVLHILQNCVDLVGVDKTVPETLLHFVTTSLIADGVFFPTAAVAPDSQPEGKASDALTTYLFPYEARRLQYDRFGATKNMSDARRQMMVLHFFFSRLLVPLVLRPWEAQIGIEPGGNPLKNLRILASVMYRAVQHASVEIMGDEPSPLPVINAELETQLVGGDDEMWVYVDASMVLEEAAHLVRKFVRRVVHKTEIMRELHKRAAAAASGAGG